MDDLELIELYFARDERALRETGEKKGRLCLTIAGNLLARREDAEECVNDAYLALWNAIPPQRPLVFSAYLARITRNLALKKWEQLSARKRNPAALTSFEELDDCLSGSESPENAVEAGQIKELIDRFSPAAERGAAQCLYPAILVFRLCQKHCRTDRLYPEQSKIHPV